jgi:protein SCO1/2
MAHSATLTEPQFAELVDAIAADAGRQAELTEFLREESPLYAGRGSAAVTRMRGWVLLALARLGLTDAALVFVLEELDTGMQPYLVAAAARALRTYPRPSATFAPFVIRAIANIRYREEPVSFAEYGEYDAPAAVTSPLQELLATLAWLGPQARGVLADIDAIQSPSGGLSRKLRAEVERIANDLRGSGAAPADQDCCQLAAGMRSMFAWPFERPRAAGSIAQATFEDHNGRSATFAECFDGQPAIVVFFYTRCDNPQKCSLTVTKLARIQRILKARGLSHRIRTAAITYDPEYDDANRIRAYGINRGVQLNENHRMLRTTDGFELIRDYFELGVNYVSSIVNRHRLEVFILDAQGRIAATFARLHWSEVDVVERARGCLSEQPARERIGVASPVMGTLACLALAFLPKCPACWAAYLSMFGIAGLETFRYAPWILIALAILMLLNLASVACRAHATRRYWPFMFVVAGAILIGLRFGAGWENASLPGLALTLIGSVGGAFAKKIATPAQPV